MKSLKTIFLLLLISSSVFAQKADKALIRVKYALSHMRDTTKRDDYYKETMLLIAGKDASVFLSYDKVLRDVEAKTYFEEQARQQAGSSSPTYKSAPLARPVDDLEYYYFASTGNIFTKQTFFTKYLTEEPGKIDWKIGQNKRTIEGINCKQATANFKGRNWTVWFTEELPFASGPWKLVGLPGLIIQAHDEKKEVQFDFAGMEKVDEQKEKIAQSSLDEHTIKKLGSSNFLTDTEIKLPQDAVKTTVKELQRLKEARAKDPQGFAKAQLAASGFSGMVPLSQGTNSSVKSQYQAPIINNPIEKNS